MSEPPHKRIRRAAKSEETIVAHPGRRGATRTRDAEFWFEDGNLILVAQDVEFRVYMGPLIKCSPVFRDMISLPQPPSGHRPYVCPVIQVWDHPDGMRCILSTFVFGNDLRFTSEDPSFDTISSIIRMGHKYEIGDAVEYALSYLRTYYPEDYDSWAQYKEGAPVFKHVHCIGIVNLARLTDFTDILPAAFWACCSLGIQDLLEGFQRTDGTRETLSPADLKNVLIARAELVKADAYACFYTLESIAGDRCRNNACHDAYSSVLQNFQEPGTSRDIRTNMTRSLVDYLVDDLGVHLCSGCRAEIRERQDVRLREMWDTFPDYFEEQT